MFGKRPWGNLWVDKFQKTDSKKQKTKNKKKPKPKTLNTETVTATEHRQLTTDN